VEGEEAVEVITVEGEVVEVQEDITGDLLHLRTDMEDMMVEEVEEDITGGLLHLKTDMEDMIGGTLHLMAEDLTMTGRLEGMRDSPPVGLTGVGMGITTNPLLDHLDL